MSAEYLTYTRDFTPRKDELLDEMIAKQWFESTFRIYSESLPSNFEVFFTYFADNEYQEVGVAFHDVPALDTLEDSHETVVLWPLNNAKTATDVFVMRKTYIEGAATPLQMYVVDAPEVYTPHDTPTHSSLGNIIRNIVTIYDVNDLWENDSTSFKEAEQHLITAWENLHYPENNDVSPNY